MKTYIVGNWKMNQTLESIQEFFVQFSKIKMEISHDVWIAPQSIHFPILKELAFTTGNIQIGVQNCSDKEQGAYTGEISPLSLKDMGAHFVIVGHSERRQIFAETNALLHQKCQAVLKNDMNVIFCIGETQEEKTLNLTTKIIKEQIEVGLFSSPMLTEANIGQLLIAYEPVWAIGTGLVATPSDIASVHEHIRQILSEALPESLKQWAWEIPLLYGGSVKPDNIAEILGTPNVNGVLVGGASLKAQDFKALGLARPYA